MALQTTKVKVFFTKFLCERMEVGSVSPAPGPWHCVLSGSPPCTRGQSSTGIPRGSDPASLLPRVTPGPLLVPFPTRVLFPWVPLPPCPVSQPVVTAEWPESWGLLSGLSAGSVGVRVSWCTLLPHEESQETHSPGSAPSPQCSKAHDGGPDGCIWGLGTKGCVEESLRKGWGGLLRGIGGRGSPWCLHGVRSHVGLPVRMLAPDCRCLV